MKEHVVQRGRTWYYTVDVGKDEAGKRRQVRKGGFKTEGDARAAARRLMVDVEKRQGAFKKPAKLTVGAYLEAWLDKTAKMKVGPKTLEGYQHIVRRHLIPGLGDVSLLQLTSERIQDYYTAKLTSGRIGGGALSPRTVRHHHVTLHTALEAAIKAKHITTNPADATDPPSFERQEMRTLDDEGLRRFLEAARGTSYYALFYISLFTAMRRSEVLGLRWSDCDLDLGQIQVNRSLHRLRDGSIVFRQPKTAKSRRGIALPPSAAIVLREHRESESAHRLLIEAQALQGEDLVFAHLDGSPLQPDTVTHAWRKLAKRTGFVGVRLHDARHTHATLMLKQGVHPKVVQERLGHATIATTLDVYSHVVPGMQEAAARNFDALLEGPVTKSVTKVG